MFSGFLIGSFFILSGLALVLALGMMVFAGKQVAVSNTRVGLWKQLQQYSTDYQWKESPVSDRQRWLAQGAIEIVDWQPTVWGRIPGERDLLTGTRVDDFWRWQAKRETLGQAERYGAIAANKTP